MRNWRQEQRKRLLRERAEISDKEREAMELAVNATLKRVLDKRAATSLSIYWPIKGELDCRGLADELLRQGWTLSVPVINDKTKCLGFAQWEPAMAMVAGTWNIPVPAWQHWVQPEILIVPLVGFDRKNYRLGYGGGYYDRTLASISGKFETIGVGMELGRLETIEPHEADIPMDIIITETGLQ